MPHRRRGELTAYRPSLGGRLRYTFGGRLAGNLDWVRHDLTDAGWRLRALGRGVAQVAPVAAVLAALPAPAVVRALLAVLVVSSSLFVTVAYAEELRDRRLRQHGLAVPGEEPGPGEHPGPGAGPGPARS